MLAQGAAREFIRAPGVGGEIALRLLRPGDAYGLVPLVDGRDNATSLVAVQTCEFLVVTRANFEAILQHHPEVFRDAMNHLCREARQAYLWIATPA